MQDGQMHHHQLQKKVHARKQTEVVNLLCNIGQKRHFRDYLKTCGTNKVVQTTRNGQLGTRTVYGE